MTSTKPLVPYIDRTDFDNAVRELLRTEPSLYSELLEVFFSDKTSHEAGTIFEYLFIAEEGPAVGAEGKVVCFRPRDPNERLIARAAFDRQDSDVAHSGPPLVSLRHNAVNKGPPIKEEPS